MPLVNKYIFDSLPIWMPCGNTPPVKEARSRDIAVRKAGITRYKNLI